jgi:hypothetical protein
VTLLLRSARTANANAKPRFCNQPNQRYDPEWRMSKGNVINREENQSVRRPANRVESRWSNSGSLLAMARLLPT